MNRLDTREPASRNAREIYDLGETTVFASRKDPRFAYCLYVPPAIAERSDKPELVVMVHGTGRTFIKYRDLMSEFGRWNHCVILCPLFPVGVFGDGNRDGFKHLREKDIRYDHVLLDMVDEVAEKYGCSFDRMGLAGYSGGAQFVNRFAYLHPERLWGVCIGAAGSVTLLDSSQDWWVGTRNAQELFGIRVDEQAVKKVPFQVLVGGADVETWEITHREGGKHWMPGANDAGSTRVERATSLHLSLVAAGVQSRLDILPGLAHDGAKFLPAMKDFLADSLAALRQSK
jgi:poly(3-hydroxybutyrate) depolymerase